ncbi:MULTISPECIES: hypothetical protein [unclassified Pseudomonas]|uniref:hypothetical protein n=1 Tax=unclassified Pseudomonas TaxID=196821 RepID=UPI0025DDB46E|nr:MULTISPECIES: hypothetical protein [unclassified Pseudomonas]
MIRALLLACVLLLSACASQDQLPAQIPHLKLPITVNAQREQAGQHQDWRVEARKRDRGVRWTLTDTTGSVLAVQDLTNDGWKDRAVSDADFEARELFGAVLFALTSAEEVRFDYPGVQLQPHARSIENRWQVSYLSEGLIRITLPDGQSYMVSPIKGKASR